MEVGFKGNPNIGSVVLNQIVNSEDFMAFANSFCCFTWIAYQHELKSKENDLFFVQDHFTELEEEYKKVLEIAKEYAEHNPVDNQ